MTEWFYVTALGDQNLILGLPWLEKHNPIIDWTEKTLEFRNSQEDKAKAFIWSLAAKKKGKRPAFPAQRIKKIEEDNTQEEDDAPADNVEEEDNQDFMEGDA
jgi:hypothetical protein